MVERQTKHIRELGGWSLGGQPYMQPIGALVELQFGIASQQGNVLHRFTAGSGCERVNDRFSVCRPGKPDGIEHVALCGETKVLGRVLRRVSVVKCPSGHFRRPLAVNPPRASAVNGFSIYIQPCSNV